MIMIDDPDVALLEFVQRAINSGTRHIVIPASLVKSASDSSLKAVRELCKVNGVSISIG